MKKSHFPSLLIVVFALIAFSMLVAVACGGSSEEAVQKIKAVATAVPAASSGAAPTAVVQATGVPSAGTTTSKVETLIAAISPPPIELILPWRGTTVAANEQVRPFADPLIAT